MIKNVGTASVGYDEATKVLRLVFGRQVIEIKNIDMEMFAELCAAFGYFRDRFNSKQEIIKYKSIDKFFFLNGKGVK